MKLHELLENARHKRPDSDFNFETSYDGIDGGVYGDIACTVYYNASDEGYTDHPYGSTTAREYHGMSVEIVDIIADEDVEMYDEDGEKVIKTFPAGTSLYDLPGWKSDDEDYFQDRVNDRVEDDAREAREQSEADRDDYDDRDDRYYY